MFQGLHCVSRIDPIPPGGHFSEACGRQQPFQHKAYFYAPVSFTLNILSSMLCGCCPTASGIWFLLLLQALRQPAMFSTSQACRPH